jgi:hypothetical protein
MYCMRFPQLSARVLDWCVSGYFIVESFSFNIYFQAFPPANAIFVGIGVLLLVGILHLSLVQNYFDTGVPRLVTMRALVKKR